MFNRLERNLSMFLNSSNSSIKARVEVLSAFLPKMHISLPLSHPLQGPITIKLYARNQTFLKAF